MDASSAVSSSPTTPKPRTVKLSTPPRLYKSNATVISLTHSPEPSKTSDHINSYYYSNEYLQNIATAYSSTPNLFSDLLPELEEPSYTPTGTPPPHITNDIVNIINNITPSRPRTYAPHPSPEKTHKMPTSQILDSISLSPQPSNPPLTILLALTPAPARLSELTAQKSFAKQFCEDFSSASYADNSQAEWCCINLYAHFRGWAARREPGGSSRDYHAMHSANIDIGSIHPYALLEKLEQEKEVHWRLFIPVLRTLIDRDVERGARAFVVSGLRVGDIEGVRAFGKMIARPAGILAFLPPPLPPVPDDEYEPELTNYSIVPPEHYDKTVTIPSTPLSQTYAALLAALYAKQLACPSKEEEEGKEAAAKMGRPIEARSRAGGICEEDYFDGPEEEMMDWVSGVLAERARRGLE